MEKVKALANKLRDHLSHLWLIGRMFQAGRKAYADALYEFSYLLIWSILPFVLGALTLYVTSDSPDKNYVELGLSTFRNGELLVFTISMLAPILYLVLYDLDESGTFPHRLPISTIVSLIAITCAALFALMKASAVKDSDFVFMLSVGLTVAALLFRYLALVYHRARLQVASVQDLRADQSNFVHQFSEHLGEPLPQEEALDATAFAQALETHLEPKS